MHGLILIKIPPCDALSLFMADLQIIFEKYSHLVINSVTKIIPHTWQMCQAWG